MTQIQGILKFLSEFTQMMQILCVSQQDASNLGPNGIVEDYEQEDEWAQ